MNRGMIEHDWRVVGMQATNISIVSASSGFSQRHRGLMEERFRQGAPYAVVGPGQQVVIEFTPSASGNFDVICEVPGHREAGMVSRLTVTGAVAAPVAASAQPVAEKPSELPAYAGSGASSPSAVVARRLPAPAMAPPVARREPAVVQVELEAQEVVGLIDEGVSIQYWTFGGTVPGPMLRVRQGDTLELTFKNAPAARVTHSIDLHAVTGPGGGAKFTQAAPGDSATLRMAMLNPGVYVYHCATPPVPQHVANGMYGLIVVEPPEGLPPVDREFYVMQGDFYLQGNRGDKGQREFSMDKMLNEQPEFVTFNGSVGSLVGENALQAQVGETIRIIFGVGGPNLVSSFHVIGEIFDRVAAEGASQWQTNIQTTLVPAGGATMVDFKVEYPGDYVLVDHSLGRLAKGAAAILHVEGPASPEIYEVIQSPGGHSGDDLH
jgi:nitrite reductase (NO-forming)